MMFSWLIVENFKCTNGIDMKESDDGHGALQHHTLLLLSLHLLYIQCQWVT